MMTMMMGFPRGTKEASPKQKSVDPSTPDSQRVSYNNKTEAST